MGVQHDLFSKKTAIKSNKEIVVSDVNSKFIFLSKELVNIEIYSIDSFKKLFTYTFNSDIAYIQAHPLYYDIFVVTLSNYTAHVCYINMQNKLIEEKSEYKCSDKYLTKTIFSPYKNGTYLATISLSDIKIWNINSYYISYVIFLGNKLLNESISLIKFSESGNYLIYPKDNNKIEIFFLEKKEIIYALKKNVEDAFFLEQEKKMILINTDESLSVLDIVTNIEEVKVNIEINSFKQSLYDYDNSIIYILEKKDLVIYDLKDETKIFEEKLKECGRISLLNANNNNDSKLFSKLILYYYNSYNFEILSIYSTNEIQQKTYSIKGGPKHFWDNSIDKIIINFNYLDFSYNQKHLNEFHPKKYLSIQEIYSESEYLLKNNTLEERRKTVDENMKNFKENSDIEIAYISFLKNLIRDNTNKELLNRYLPFLQKNQDNLKLIYEEENFESYENEIRQFQACFNQITLSGEIIFKKNEKEIDKLFHLLKEILSLDENDNDKLEDFMKSQTNELENFRFNQPISLDQNEELYICRNRIIILYNLKKIIESKKFKKITNMKYCIGEVLKRNFFNNDKIMKDNVLMTLIIILIAVPQRDIITVYNLNLLDDKDIDVTEDKLKNLNFQYNPNLKAYENKAFNIIIEKDKIELYNLKNLALYIKTGERNIFSIYELYKYNALKDYYNNIYDEQKIRKFLIKILTSNVIKEAFSFFYGKDIKYPFLDDTSNLGENKAKNYLNKYLKFVPLKMETNNAVTEKFSMETYIFLNRLTIYSYLNQSQNNLSKDEQIIMKALVNGSIVAIHDNEVNHNFHNYFYCCKNGNEPLKTPRKIYGDEREGGNNMERILFGRVLYQLTLRQALFILNEENYNKPLNQFRKEFLELKKENCEPIGIFQEYSNLKFDVEELSDFMVVRFKSAEYNIKYISIKLKDDVLGFPNFYGDSYQNHN